MMGHVAKKGWIIVLGLVLLASTGQAQAKELDAKNPIIMGYMNAFTGPATLLTTLEVPGIQLAVEEINSTGGILGRPLKLITRDDKLNPETGVREAKDLVVNEKVSWIHGCTSSGVARAVSAYMKGEKKIFATSVAKSEKLTADWGHRYFFRPTTNAEQEAVATARAAVKIFGPLKKLYNCSPDYEGGHASWRTFLAAYKKLVPDAVVVGEAWPKLGNQDFTANITAIMNSEAQLVFTCFYQTDILTLIKQSRSLGMDGKVAIAAIWGGFYDVVQKYNKDFYPQKTIAASHYPFWAMDTPASKAFVEKLKSKYNVLPSFSVNSYAFTKLMAKTINKVGSLDTEKVVDALEGAMMETPVGPIEIRACDHQSMWPFMVGLVGPVPGWDFYGPRDLVSVGKEAYPSCEDIAKLRKP